MLEQTELLELDGKKRPSLLSVCRVEAETLGSEAHLVAGRFHKPEEFRRRDQCDDLPKFRPMAFESEYTEAPGAASSRMLSSPRICPGGTWGIA